MAGRWERFLERVRLRRSVHQIERELEWLRQRRLDLVSRRDVLEANRPQGGEPQVAYDYQIQIVKVNDQITDLDRQISRLQDVLDARSWH